MYPLFCLRLLSRGLHNVGGKLLNCQMIVVADDDLLYAEFIGNFKPTAYGLEFQLMRFWTAPCRKKIRNLVGYSSIRIDDADTDARQYRRSFCCRSHRRVAADHVLPAV